MFPFDVTTVAAIAIGNAISRPPSMDDIWISAPAAYKLHTLVLTEKTLFNTPQAKNSDYFIEYATSFDHEISKVDWLCSEICTYSALSDGWDGEGSVAPDEKSIAAALRLANNLPAGLPLPKPMLSSDGEVGLYWKNDKYLADIVIESNNTCSLFIRFESDAREVFIEDIAINENAAPLIKAAFA